VKVEVALSGGLALTIADGASTAAQYPTRRLQRGLLLSEHGAELAEEGVGFGVPILKRGLQTVFPGGLELAERRAGDDREVTAAFAMNLVERLAGPDGATVGSQALYAAKNSLAALHRRAPALRRPLTAVSNALRRSRGWRTTFEEAASTITLKLTYTIREGGGAGARAVAGVKAGTAAASVTVTADLTGLPVDGISEVVLMNELGARRFDRYVDADGADLRGPEIGTWDVVTAARASFVSDAYRVAFSVAQADGATLHRGRELIGSRLAWSGFGYSLPPTLGRFAYDLTIARTL
jgi:hypothetical protein